MAIALLTSDVDDEEKFLSEWPQSLCTRSYNSEESECDNIRGFTYSGGLLRHQCEVHRQHGGPAPTCMCSHKDCVRSTSAGFSHKENLNKHLRQSHQPHDQDTGRPLELNLRHEFDAIEWQVLNYAEPRVCLQCPLRYQFLTSILAPTRNTLTASTAIHLSQQRCVNC